MQPEYWYALADSTRIWFAQEIFIGQSLVNLAAVLAGLILAWLMARPLRPKLSEAIASHNLEHTTSGRFLYVFEQTLTFVFATIILWLFMAAFQQLGLKVYLIDLIESLLVAWVLIRLITSIVREVYWSRFIAITVWLIAALHILSLLKPSLALLNGIAITVGDTRLSALLFIKATIILFIMVRLALLVSTLINERISALEGLTPSMQVLLSKTIAITLTVMAVLIAISSLGIDLYTFAFIGGAVGVGVGFGLQKVISNLVSGFVLLLDRSIKPGDVIAIDGTYGQIREMGARYLSIVTRDGAEYLIPNEDLITRQVINWSFSSTHLRIKIGVGVSYDADVHKVMELMIKAARVNERVLGDPQPVCQLKNFGDNSIKMELRFWISDPENGIANISSAIRMAIWDAFKANGITIPYPQRVVHMTDQSPE